MPVWFRRALALLIAATAVCALVAWYVSAPTEHTGTPHFTPPEPRAQAPVDEPAHIAAPSSSSRGVAPKPSAPDASADAGANDAESGEDMQHDAIAQAWSKVDLEEVHRAMPNNLYFKLSAPTKDEALLAERDAERTRWNVEYGKILSGTSTEEDIRAYFDQRARLSGDYVEFATYLLDHYRTTLPERDVGLLELARRLHLARLEEIPRQVEEARERQRQQDEARAAWLADEAELGSRPAGTADSNE